MYNFIPPPPLFRCANGYFMFRMLAEQPKLVVGIDPNLKAWLEFQALKAFAGPAAANLHFEVLDGGELHFPVGRVSKCTCMRLSL